MKKQIITAEQLAAMTPAEQRVAIAKDVIKQIKEQKLIVRCGRYAALLHAFDLPNGPVVGGKFSQQTLLREDVRCEVCAVGAAIVSGLRLFNGASFDIIWSPDGEGAADKAHWFSRSQTALIERAFEKKAACIIANCLPDCAPTGELLERVLAFKRRYRSPRKRVLAIYRNIIRNNGEFKP